MKRITGDDTQINGQPVEQHERPDSVTVSFFQTGTHYSLYSTYGPRTERIAAKDTTKYQDDKSKKDVKIYNK